MHVHKKLCCSKQARRNYIFRICSSTKIMAAWWGKSLLSASINWHSKSANDPWFQKFQLELAIRATGKAGLEWINFECTVHWAARQCDTGALWRATEFLCSNKRVQKDVIVSSQVYTVVLSLSFSSSVWQAKSGTIAISSI